jgi:hypothetical protein
MNVRAIQGQEMSLTDYYYLKSVIAQINTEYLREIII